MILRFGQPQKISTLESLTALRGCFSGSTSLRSVYTSYLKLSKPTGLTPVSVLEHAWKSLVFSATYNQDLEENFIKKGIEDRVAQFREVVLVSLHRQARQEANSIRALVTQLNYLVDYAQWKAGMSLNSILLIR